MSRGRRKRGNLVVKGGPLKGILASLGGGVTLGREERGVDLILGGQAEFLSKSGGKVALWKGGRGRQEAQPARY